MILNNDKISARQLYRMIVASLIGMTCLLSTDISVSVAGRDGGFCILGAFILTLLYGVLIIWLCRKVGWNYTKYAEEHFSRAVNKAIYFVFFIKYVVLLVLSCAVLLRMVRNELLTEMGYIGILIPVLLLLAYSVSRGLEARARMTECMIYVIVIPIITLAVLGINGTDRFYLVPVFHGNISGIIWGSVLLFLLFSPLEMILFMSGNINMKQTLDTIRRQAGKNMEQKIEKAIIGGIITIFAVNMIFYLISVGNLSSNVVMAKGDAVISLAKSVKLPYLVFEKQGGLFMLFFVLSLFIAIFCLAHHAMSMAEKLMGKKSRVSYVAFVLIAFIGVYVAVNYTDYFSTVTHARETRVEIENREYADSMIIDYEKEKYIVMLTFPAGEEETRLEEYKISSLDTLKNEYGRTSDKRLDLSHIQVVIMSEEILKNEEVFRSVISFLENEAEISDSLNVCATRQNRKEIIENVEQLNTLPGKYISKMLENNIRYAKTQFKKISLVMYDAEQSCLISVFSFEGEKISYEGNLVVSKSGFVTEYRDNEAQIMELASGGSGIQINLDTGRTVTIDKNNYYMNVDIIGDDTIHVKLIYSGRMSEYQESGYCISSEEEEEFNVDAVNEIIQTMIFDNINTLAKEYHSDILGIYKHLAFVDRKQWNKYKDSQEDMFGHLFVEVDVRYEWS